MDMKVGACGGMHVCSEGRWQGLREGVHGESSGVLGCSNPGWLAEAACVKQRRSRVMGGTPVMGGRGRVRPPVVLQVGDEGRWMADPA